MQELKRNFTNLNHQIRQLKNELREKDQNFLAEHFNVDQVDKDVLLTFYDFNDRALLLVAKNDICEGLRDDEK